jgi:hypothetical protein
MPGWKVQYMYNCKNKSVCFYIEIRKVIASKTFDNRESQPPQIQPQPQPQPDLQEPRRRGPSWPGEATEPLLRRVTADESQAEKMKH